MLEDQLKEVTPVANRTYRCEETSVVDGEENYDGKATDRSLVPR